MVVSEIQPKLYSIVWDSFSILYLYFFTVTAFSLVKLELDKFNSLDKYLQELSTAPY
jgi:hypothetical protein